MSNPGPAASEKPPAKVREAFDNHECAKSPRPTLKCKAEGQMRSNSHLPVWTISCTLGLWRNRPRAAVFNFEQSDPFREG